MSLSPFTLYLLLKLDALQSLLTLAAGALLIATWFTFIAGDDFGLHPKTSKRCLLGAILCCVTAALAPDTKEAAAILVVPAVVSSPVVQDEAKELYDLGKEALRAVVEGRNTVEDKE